MNADRGVGGQVTGVSQRFADKFSALHAVLN